MQPSPPVTGVQMVARTRDGRTITGVLRALVRLAASLALRTRRRMARRARYARRRGLG